MSTHERASESAEDVAAASRFAYHTDDDDPGEGGVFSTRRPASAGVVGAGGARASANGVPGPDEPLLDISELVRNVGMRYTHRFRFPVGGIKDLETVSPTEGQISLTNTGALLLLRGMVTATLRVECIRCLTPMDQPVEAELEEEFDIVSRHNAFRQEEAQAVDDDTPASVITGNVLDLADLLRQNLLLSAPPQPLCREDCPGLLDGVVVAGGTAADVPLANPDNPLRHLAQLLEAHHNGDESSPG